MLVWSDDLTCQILLQSRLAINSVTLGNFEEPIRISIFVKDIFAGFAMVHLTNRV